MRELKGDWRDIFNCFMVALDLRKLVLAFIGGMLSFLVLGLDAYFLARMMHHDFVERARNVATTGSAFSIQLFGAEMHIGLQDLPFVNLIGKVLVPALATIASDPVLSLAYFVVVILTVSVIWSYFGGAITRIAAIEITKDERIDIQRSLEFVKGRYNSYFWSLAACAVGFLFFFFTNMLVGLLGREWFGLGNLLGIVLMAIYPVALLTGFLMVMMSVGTLFGYPLYYPAISVEGTDMFDAISRGFSYVFSRPWHYIFYQMTALLFGVVSVGFVWTFGGLTIRFAEISGGLGMGSDRFAAIQQYAAGSIDTEALQLALGWGGYFGVLSSFIYLVWMVIIVGLLASYAISYFFSAQTMIYLLLRKKVDGIEMNEIHEEKTEEEPLFPLKAETTAQKPAQPSAAKPPSLVPLSVIPGTANTPTPAAGTPQPGAAAPPPAKSEDKPAGPA